LKEKGFEVSGSDHALYPPMSDQLADLKIPVFSGFRAENIEKATPDLVVVGNAVSKNNEEVGEVERRKIPMLSMPQALHQFFLKDRISIVVAGTHGKTTTAGLLSWMLERLGFSPGFFVGGMLKNFGRSFQVGSGKYFVVEGDEYDTAFFDKGPKFLHYAPQILILNAVEFDHADIYRDLEHLLQSFRQLIALLPKDGLIVVDGENENARRLVQEAACRVIAKNLSEAPSLKSPLMGRHNQKNLLAVVAVLQHLGVSLEKIQEALLEFQGVKRRQEILATVRGVTVIDDFAHHPTAVRETLLAIRTKYPRGRLWAIFEPRSNTTRRKVFQEEFARAFDSADKIIIAGVYLAEKIPEGERLDPAYLAAEIQARGQEAAFLPMVDDIVVKISQEVKNGDIVCLMSNGAFSGIHQKIVKKLSEL